MSPDIPRIDDASSRCCPFGSRCEMMDPSQFTIGKSGSAAQLGPHDSPASRPSAHSMTGSIQNVHLNTKHSRAKRASPPSVLRVKSRVDARCVRLSKMVIFEFQSLFTRM